MSRTLIAYYSRSGENYTPQGPVKSRIGNTAWTAQILEELTGADVFKIDMAQPYSEEYEECTRQAKYDRENAVLPELKNRPDPTELEGLETLFLCYPNYWNGLPMVVQTFLRGIKTKGVRILPLCTHGGDGIGFSEQEIAEICPNATLAPGLAVEGHLARGARQDVLIWLMQNGIAFQQPEE